MKIEKWIKYDIQYCSIGKYKWSVARLITLSKDIKVMTIPLDHLNVYNSYENLTLREMVTHINAVMDADLSFPIIMDEDGIIMDGRHRIMAAMQRGEKSIKAVRFDVNPEPCEVVGD